MNRYFKPALKKAKLPMMRWHDLRHTFASLMIHQGENIKYIQSQLGHSSPTVTLNVYAHLMNPVNQESACRLENTIFSANSSKMVAGSWKMKSSTLINTHQTIIHTPMCLQTPIKKGPTSATPVNPYHFWWAILVLNQWLPPCESTWNDKLY